MAELADTVTIPGPVAYASNDVYFPNGGAAQYLHGVRIVPPETRVWDTLGVAWNYIGTNWNSPAAGTALGSGGLIWFTVHNQLADGLPDMSSALATEQLAADSSGPGAGGNVYRYDQRTRALIGATTNSFLIHMSIPAGLSVVAGLPIWLVIRNMHADPVLNASGPNWVTTRNTILLPDGTVKTPPNHVNTITAASSYSTHGLDPREVVASKALATDPWVFSTAVGRYPGASSGVDNGNDHARIPVYFWRELGSTRLRSKMPFTGQRIASAATPTVTRMDAVNAASLKYALANPTTAGTCTVTAQVLNADGTNNGSAVVSPASAAAPTGGGPVVVQFAAPVAVAAGQGIRLTCSKAVWMGVADAYLRRVFDESDDWQYTSNSAPHYPDIVAFGARGVADWPWSHSNRQAAATGQAGATAVATNLVASANTVTFAATRGAASPDAKRVRIVDTSAGASRGFTATVTGDSVGWLRVRVGTTGAVGTTATGTADTDLYLLATNQATSGNYTATVGITPAQGGDTIPAIAASMSVTDAQPVGPYDAEVAAVATRFWKLEELTGDFPDSKGGASLALTGTGAVRGIDINAPVSTTTGFRVAVDALGSAVIAHWPLGEAAGGGATGTTVYSGLSRTNSVAGKTSDAVPWPTSTAIGDVVVLAVHIESATAVTTAVASGGSTAWVQRDSTRITASGDRNSIWTKRVEAGDLANPISVTWGGIAVRCTSTAIRVTAAKATGEFVNQVSGATGAAATFTAPGFTTTQKSLILYIEMSRWDLNETPPAGYTERQDLSATEIYVASLDQGAAGAVAAAGATTPAGESTDYAAFLIAIEPEGVAVVNAVDRKGARNGVANGAITRNVTTLLTDGTADGAVQVGGTDTVPTTGYFEVPATTALQTPAFTVMAWVKVTGGQGTSRTVISYRDSGVSIARGWYIVAASTNRWRFLVGLSDNTFVTVESVETVQVGQTVFLTGTWEGGVPKLYVNAGAANSTVPSGTYNQTHAVSRPLRIGAGRNETTANDFFRGVIDECVLLTQALSANQIQAHYLAGTSGATSPPPPPPPSPPGVILVTNFRAVGQVLNWTAVSGASGYTVAAVHSPYTAVAARELYTVSGGSTTSFDPPDVTGEVIHYDITPHITNGGYLGDAAGGDANRVSISYATSPPPPTSSITVTTLAPSATTTSTLQLLGQLTNLAGTTGTAVFQYGTSSTNLSSTTPGEAINGIDQFVSHLVTGLNAGTMYFFRLAFTPATGGQLFGSTLSASTQAPTSPPPGGGPTFGPLLTSITMESGNLNEWSGNGSGGGGIFDTLPAVSSASQDRAHTGSWSARMRWAGPPTAEGEPGCRLFRWAELNANRELYIERWLFIPSLYTLNGSGGQFMMLDQFKSRTSTRNDPIWYIDAYPQGGAIVPYLTWGPQSGLAGPTSGEAAGQKNYNPTGNATLPIGSWFKLTSFIRQSSAFDGTIRYWLNDVLIHDRPNVRTGHPNNGQTISNAWGVDQHWAINNYSDGISPSPFDVYVDDVKIYQVP